MLSRKRTRRRSCMRPWSMASEPRCASERKYTFFIPSVFRVLSVTSIAWGHSVPRRASRVAGRRGPQSVEAQFHPGLFGHHALVPYGLEHEVHRCVAHTVDGVDLLPDVFK